MLPTAPLGSGLRPLPFHFYGGFTPEWYRRFAGTFGLTVEEITANGGDFKLLTQECARFSWTFDAHRHCHGKQGEALRELLGDVLPRYLLVLDEQQRDEQFTIGDHVELRKPEAADASPVPGVSAAAPSGGPPDAHRA